MWGSRQANVHYYFAACQNSEPQKKYTMHLSFDMFSKLKPLKISSIKCLLLLQNCKATRTFLPRIMGISVLPVQEEGVGSGGHGGSSVTGHFQRQHLNTWKKTTHKCVSCFCSPAKPGASHYRARHCGCKYRSGSNTAALMISGCTAVPYHPWIVSIRP